MIKAEFNNAENSKKDANENALGIAVENTSKETEAERGDRFAQANNAAILANSAAKRAEEALKTTQELESKAQGFVLDIEQHFERLNTVETTESPETKTEEVVVHEFKMPKLFSQNPPDEDLEAGLEETGGETDGEYEDIPEDQNFDHNYFSQDFTTPEAQTPEEPHENTIEELLYQIQMATSIQSVPSLLRIKEQAIHDGYFDNPAQACQIHHELVQAAIALDKLNLAVQFCNDACRKQCLSAKTCRSMIEYTGQKKNKEGVSIYYNHLKEMSLLTDETYLLAMQAYALCGAVDAVWDIYANDIPSRLKATSADAHVFIMHMVCYQEDKTQAYRISYAIRAYENVLDAKLPVLYDGIHALMLRIIHNYFRVNDFLDSIKQEILKTTPQSELSMLNLTNIELRKCMELREELQQRPSPQIQALYGQQRFNRILHRDRLQLIAQSERTIPMQKNTSPVSTPMVAATHSPGQKRSGWTGNQYVMFPSNSSQESLLTPAEPVRSQQPQSSPIALQARFMPPAPEQTPTPAKPKGGLTYIDWSSYGK